MFSRTDSRRYVPLVWCLLVATFLAPLLAATPSDPLPSWNNGATKQSIIDFVGRVTKSGDADFVPEARRVAVFDNDGTLWAEQPIYFQLAFALDTIKSMVPSHRPLRTGPLSI